ncbi:pentapeptide repeat-containing protein [Micromonospora haikouensis]|uniref:pentapeptide repeat-containing protein n=1 Tax=Micromonospora haikouensis TaxID=686309 RepID=UPI0037A0FBFF
MQDSPDDEPTVIEVLCAFIRDHPLARPRDSAEDQPKATEDLRAAITVLARRPNPDLAQNSRLDFGYTELSLFRISLQKANLRGAYLSKAFLGQADLRDADLRETNLSHAFLSAGGPSSLGAQLDRADLRQAFLYAADLTDAEVQSADLRDARLLNANLLRTDLRGADLSTALDLTNDMLACAYVDDRTQLPPNIKRPPPLADLPWEELPSECRR